MIDFDKVNTVEEFFKLTEHLKTIDITKEEWDGLCSLASRIVDTYCKEKSGPSVEEILRKDMEAGIITTEQYLEVIKWL